MSERMSHVGDIINKKMTIKVVLFHAPTSADETFDEQLSTTVINNHKTMYSILMPNYDKRKEVTENKTTKSTALRHTTKQISY